MGRMESIKPSRVRRVQLERETTIVDIAPEILDDTSLDVQSESTLAIELVPVEVETAIDVISVKPELDREDSYSSNSLVTEEPIEKFPKEISTSCCEVNRERKSTILKYLTSNGEEM